jgi:hypothetical protein
MLETGQKGAGYSLISIHVCYRIKLLIDCLSNRPLYCVAEHYEISAAGVYFTVSGYSMNFIDEQNEHTTEVKIIEKG